jgi:formylmethanofuran dehydrogenase subunit C
MIILQRHLSTTLPIEVDGILPNRLSGMSELEVNQIPIWLGKEQVPLGDVFKVRIEPGSELTLRWTGELSNVHWIGNKLDSGCVEIESAAGRHVGSQMSAGTMIVHGSVGDFAGAEMRGGLLKIQGDAGNHLGGCYPGSKWGMNRGEILVSGDAGQGTGEWMRRGLIAVAGRVGRLCGWNLLAGTIVVGGPCGGDCGSGMVRGTIVQLGRSATSISPMFLLGGSFQGGTLGLLATRLREIGFESASDLARRHFDMFHGDQTRGGRGELFVVRDP